MLRKELFENHSPDLQVGRLITSAHMPPIGKGMLGQVPPVVLLPLPVRYGITPFETVTLKVGGN